MFKIKLLTNTDLIEQQYTIYIRMRHISCYSILVSSFNVNNSSVQFSSWNSLFLHSMVI